MADAINEKKHVDHRSIDVNPFKIIEMYVLDPEQQKRSQVEVITLKNIEGILLDEKSRRAFIDKLNLSNVYIMGTKNNEGKVKCHSFIYTDLNKLLENEKYIRALHKDKNLKTYSVFI